jgi:hypothetical protein
MTTRIHVRHACARVLLFAALATLVFAAVSTPRRTGASGSPVPARKLARQEGGRLDIRLRSLTTRATGRLTVEPSEGGGRVRMTALFDLSTKHRALPLGTGNKTERLFGYFTWHADDSPPINPLGDLFKTQVWALARHLGVPEVVVSKPASADLISGQTDEGDFGISYPAADRILNWLLSGYSARDLCERGFDAADVERVRRRLDGTHWKRRPPTVAMLSPSAIGESYLRPVDY